MFQDLALPKALDALTRSGGFTWYADKQNDKITIHVQKAALSPFYDLNGGEIQQNGPDVSAPIIAPVQPLELGGSGATPGASNAPLLYRYQKQETRSTFTCPNCGKKTTVVQKWRVPRCGTGRVALLPVLRQKSCASPAARPACRARFRRDSPFGSVRPSAPPPAPSQTTFVQGWGVLIKPADTKTSCAKPKRFYSEPPNLGRTSSARGQGGGAGGPLPLREGAKTHSRGLAISPKANNFSPLARLTQTAISCKIMTDLAVISSGLKGVSAPFFCPFSFGFVRVSASLPRAGVTHKNPPTVPRSFAFL